jgi:hypothetical protein
MTFFRKLASGRLSRAIVALTGRGGNKTLQMAEANLSEVSDPQVDNDSARMPLRKRTTMTLETETLLVVRSERRSSGSALGSRD